MSLRHEPEHLKSTAQRRWSEIKDKQWFTKQLRKHKWLLAIVFFFLMFVGVATALYLRPDPDIARVNALRKQLSAMGGRSRGKGGQKMTDQQKQEYRKLWKQYEQAKETLSPEQREQLDAQRREQWKERMKKGMEKFEGMLDGYLAMSKSQQNAFLDQKINESEARRRRWEQMKAKWRASGKKFGRRGGRSRTTDPKARDDRSRRRLDFTTPEFRAKFVKFRDDMNARRRERGLTVHNGRRGSW